jgi:MarR family transcriptional regulator, lower aerobic nicotinate degradation pathway regulator
MIGDHAQSGERSTAPATTASSNGLSLVLSQWHAFLLRKAAQRVTALAEAVLAPLTLRHFGVLSAAAAEPGLNQRVIGERLRIDRTTIVAVTDDLEGAGLLERRRGSDRRTFALFLTETGRGRLAELERRVAEVHAEFLKPLSAAERTTLRALLLRLT